MFVNLTPHPINVYGKRSLEEGPEGVIQPSGDVARLATIDLGGGGEIAYVEYGRIDGLPQPVAGVNYVVSLVVALAARGRSDLVAPWLEVRNETGTVVGCRMFQRVC